jgi:hypothetical protein
MLEYYKTTKIIDFCWFRNSKRISKNQSFYILLLYSIYYMKTSKVQNYILFTLGKWFEEANKKIKNSSLKVSISKTTFIDLVKTAKFAKKQERALYKNLEILEKKKLVEYQNKELELTKRGKKLYEEINDSLKPFFNVFQKLKDKNPIGYTKKVQTIFK